MCRILAVSAAPRRIRAKFWLLDAPTSFVNQSRENPDGWGIGRWDLLNRPRIDKEPIAAFEDLSFQGHARIGFSTTFISHVRYATTGPKTTENCHPFLLDDRLFAHNGTVKGLPEIEARLGKDRALVKGDTDSERYFALITKEIREHGGDVTAGIRAAVNWLADNVPVCAMNFVLASQKEVWAFRYPDTNTLFEIERPAFGRELRYLTNNIRLRSLRLRGRPCVIVASQRLDDHPGWRMLKSGELFHIGPDRKTESTILIDHPPAEYFLSKGTTAGTEAPAKPRPRAHHAVRGSAA
jgi:predicted glutamine amidotransferase